MRCQYITCCFFYAPREYLGGVETSPLRPMLCTYVLWAWRDLYRAIPAVMRDFGFCGFSQRTTPYRVAFNSMQEVLRTYILTRIPTEVMSCSFEHWSLYNALTEQHSDDTTSSLTKCPESLLSPPESKRTGHLASEDD